MQALQYKITIPSNYNHLIFENSFRHKFYNSELKSTFFEALLVRKGDIKATHHSYVLLYI